MKFTIKGSIAGLLLFLGSVCGYAQQEDYSAVAAKRAEKIVAALNISDAAKQNKVSEIIAAQYIALNNAESKFKSETAEIKANTALDKKESEAKIEKAKANNEKAVAKLHGKYVKALNKQLSAEQVDKVKDGMTYNVLPITYKGYLEMLPTLTEKQKAQIYAWLVEAREHAIDAGSSNMKHWWFGKYKGRINNYLSKEGVETTKARAVWEQKLKEKEEAAKQAAQTGSAK